MNISLHVRDSEPDAVERVARTLECASYISTGAGAWVSLFPQSPAEPASLHRLAELLSAGLGHPVWGILVDPGAFFYVLYESGSLRDEYAAPSDKFGGRSLPGKPDALKPLALPHVSRDQLARVLSGKLTMGADDSQFREKMRETIRGTSAESIGQMLGLAAQHLGQLPPDMLKKAMMQAGVPADHPMLAGFLQNPGGFLQQMASNPQSLDMLKSQVERMSEESLSANLGGAEAAPEVRLLELTKLVGVQSAHMAMTYDTLAGAAVPGYRKVQAG